MQKIYQENRVAEPLLTYDYEPSYVTHDFEAKHQVLPKVRQGLARAVVVLTAFGTLACTPQYSSEAPRNDERASAQTLVDFISDPISASTKETLPDKEVVQEGDSIEKIAKRVLLKRGEEISRKSINDLASQIKTANPELRTKATIFPGQILLIPKSPEAVHGSDYLTLADVAVKKLHSHIVEDGDKTWLRHENDPRKPAYSWGAAISGEALTRYNQARPNAPDGLTSKQLANLIGNYWDGSTSSKGYAVLPDSIGDPSAERYIDDGNWDAQLRIQQYASQLKHGETPGSTALDEAQAMLDIAIQNYSPDIGLVYWKKQHSHEPNHMFSTISTSTAIELALMINQFTPDKKAKEKNLAFATQAYKSVRTAVQDPTDSLYEDGIALDGTIDQRKFPYCAGTMIGAGMWLYFATGEQHYLKEAEETAASALNFYHKEHRLVQDPALLAIYFDRLYDLRKVTSDEALRSSIKAAILDYAHWFGRLTRITDAPRPGGWSMESTFVKPDHAFNAVKVHVNTLAAYLTSESL